MWSSIHVRGIVLLMICRCCLAISMCLCCTVQFGQAQVGSLRWRAEQAKEHNKSHVEIFTHTTPPGEVSDLDDLLPSTTIVLARPLESVAMTEDGYNITTWYKFKVLDTLHAPNKRALCESLPPIPQGLLPLNEGEIVIPVMGGTITFDSVVIHQSFSSLYAFKDHDRHMLFLERLQNSTVAAYIIIAGASGVYRVGADGELSSVAPNRNTRLIKEVLSHGTIEHLQNYIVSRK